MTTPNKKNRILFIHHAIEPGGAPRSLAFLLHELPNDKHEPFVLMPADSEVAEMFRETGAIVLFDIRITHLLPGPATPIYSPIKVVASYVRCIRSVRPVSEMVKHLKPDIVHLNSNTLFMAAAGARLASSEVSIVCHSRETLNGGLADPIIRYYNQRYCDEFIFIDEDGMKSFKAPARKSRVIYNAIDTQEYRPRPLNLELRREYGIKDSDVAILFLARFCRINGVLEATNMIRKLPKEFSHVHFLFVGYGKEPRPSTFKSWVKGHFKNSHGAYLKRVLSEAEKSPNVHAIPMTKDVVPFLSAADVILCPFTKPHFARCIVEGAAMGIPSLTADIPSVRTPVQNGITGLLYNPKSQKSFENCLSKLALSPQTRKSMGHNARQFACKNFDSRKNARAIYEFYEELLSNGTTNSP
jgi:glycosyltransferase involved in cell wall biosynthesis